MYERLNRRRSGRVALRLARPVKPLVFTSVRVLRKLREVNASSLRSVVDRLTWRPL